MTYLYAFLLGIVITGCVILGIIVLFCMDYLIFISKSEHIYKKAINHLITIIIVTVVVVAGFLYLGILIFPRVS